MIEAKDFLQLVRQEGYRFFTGVPCSFLKPFINTVIQDRDLMYIGASSEGEAVALAIGAHLAGQKTVMMCQNSGLGNMVNPLTSLCYPFRIPILLITTLRGDPAFSDEPQHELIGQITGDLFTTMRIPSSYFPTERVDVESAFRGALQQMHETSLPYAFIMRKGTVRECPLEFSAMPVSPKRSHPEGTFHQPGIPSLKRIDAIRIVREVAGRRAALIGTTGKTGRELFTLGDEPNQLYVVGGMGCAAGIGLGIKLAKPDQPLIVLDGDGAALMKLGTMATIGYHSLAGFLHVVLDNESHDSTGGQKTVSSHVDFASVASACSYARSWRTDTAQELREMARQALKEEGPVMIHVKIRPGSLPDLARPDQRPVEVKRRFMHFLAGGTGND